MFFFAINRNSNAPPLTIDPAAVITRLMPFSPPDKSGFVADEDSLLVHCLHWNSARARLEAAPFRHAASGMTAASWARLDNRDELAQKLAIAPAELAATGDTELILLCYLKWGEACIEQLIGDFVFIIHDRKENKIFCGRDHMGVKPLYYLATDDLFICTTSLAAMGQLERQPLAVDPQWVAAYLLQLSKSFDRTAFRGVYKLPPAHCLTVTPQTVRLRQYFTLSAEPELRLADSRDYVAAYREVLEEAIRCRLDSDYPIGTELSGGIDSSTVTAFAAKFLPQPATQLHTFGFVFSEREPEYIMAVSRACRLHNNHLVAGRETGTAAVRQRALALLGYPAENGNATIHEPFYRLAEQLGVRTLLSGFGGDEFGTTIHGYMVPMAMAVDGRYRELFNILQGSPLFRFLRLVKLEWRRRKSANFTTALQSPGFYDAYRNRWPHRVVRDELVARYGLEERYFEEARFDAGYSDLKKFTLEKRWQPFIPTRMENCTLMAAGRQIDYRWPLLDIRLVRLFLAIPAEENFYRGMGRYLHRRAIDGVVPKMVTWKPGKDMGAVMGQQPDDARDMLHLDVAGLHPMLGDFIDRKKLHQQAEQLPQLLNSFGDERRFQFRKNIQAALEVSHWLNNLEGKRELS